MIRFWGQDKYSQRELIGYELFLREYNDGQWRFPADFGKFTASEFAQTLVDTIGALPAGIQLVSINLDQPQFIDPQYINQLGVAQRACPDTLIIVELTERPYNVPIAQLVTAAAAYQDLGLWVCLDDVGTGANQVDLVEALAPHVKEYKFALQNFHNKRDFVTVVTRNSNSDAKKLTSTACSSSSKASKPRLTSRWRKTTTQRLCRATTTGVRT